jgi:polyisoprenoid-binding protein YceI
MGRLKWLIVAVVVFAAAVVGGAFIYASVDEAPAELRLSDSPTETTLTPSAEDGDITGTWQATSRSVVGYRVKETLFGADNEAYGRTSEVEGTMTINGTTINAVDLTVDMASVSSDRTQRDGQFRGRIMETSTYPTARFKLTQPIELNVIPAAGAEIAEQATGELTLHGVTKTVTFDLKAQRTGSSIEVNGKIPIEFADYEIDDPSGGPARTEDNGILEFLVVFSK